MTQSAPVEFRYSNVIDKDLNGWNKITEHTFTFTEGDEILKNHVIRSLAERDSDELLFNGYCLMFLPPFSAVLVAMYTTIDRSMSIPNPMGLITGGYRKDYEKLNIIPFPDGFEGGQLVGKPSKVFRFVQYTVFPANKVREDFHTLEELEAIPCVAEAMDQYESAEHEKDTYVGLRVIRERGRLMLLSRYQRHNTKQTYDLIVGFIYGTEIDSLKIDRV